MDVGDEDKLKAIKVESSLKDDPERAKNMFQNWLDMKPHASWNDLIAVLRAPHIGLCTLAYEIEGKLISEGTYTVMLSLHISNGIYLRSYMC